MASECKEEQLTALMSVPQDPYLVGIAHDTLTALMETQPGQGWLDSWDVAFSLGH